MTPIRIAAWSGPRNISTAMMRAWENREDCVVSDEPMYAHYLQVTQLDHPGRDEVIAAGDTDLQRVIDTLRGPVPEDIGLLQQRTLFDAVAQRLGQAPPVFDAEAFLQAPEAQLRALCGRLGLDFSPRMLHWPPGPRASDGVWAPHWYDAVWKSTGFEPWRDKRVPLPPALAAVAEACRPAYERLLACALATDPID